MAGTLVQNVRGSQRELVDRVTLVNSQTYPFMASCNKGPTVANVNYEWPVDKFEDAEDNAIVDGRDVTSFDDALEQYEVLNNRVQWVREDAMVSKLSQDVQNQAGVRDKKAYSVKKKIEKLWRDIETAFCSDNEMQVGTGAVPNKLRGLGVWIQATAQSVSPVPTAYLTPSGNIHSGTIAALTESVWQGLLQNIWENSTDDTVYTMFCGATLKRAITGFTNTDTGATNVFAPVRTYEQMASEKKIVNVVDYYEGDFGKVELIPTRYNAKLTSAAATTRRGYIMNMKNVDLVWKQMPQVQALPDLGGGPRFCVDGIVGLRLYNPLSHGKISSTS